MKMKNSNKNWILTMGLAAILMVVSCNDEDDMETQTSMFTVTITNVMEGKDYFESGVFNTPDGASDPGPATPGSSYSFTFHAGKGHYLSFATMFVQSNDLFYAPADSGIPLYDTNGDPLSGDITEMIDLWDAGTEVNQEPYVGSDQAPRQSGADTGPDENGVVQLVNDDFNYPADENIIEVTITPGSDYSFTVTIENISTGDDATPLAPGVFVVHSEGQMPLFENGMADFGDGLEGLAEDGAAGGLAEVLGEDTGYVSPLAPGVFAIHMAGAYPLFESGAADRREGLEALAEDGDPSGLSSALSANDDVSESGVFNTPDGESAPGPLFPDGTYSFSFEASEGESLSFATMLVQTNDLFYAFSGAGVQLFEDGMPISGDVTSQIMLWDAGTEVNEYPGAGSDQAPRQAGPDTGANENGNVLLVSDGNNYPAVSSVIQVTISAL